MLCRHTVLSIQMVAVMRVVYWGTVVNGDGSAVMMVCWKD